MVSSEKDIILWGNSGLVMLSSFSSKIAVEPHINGSIVMVMAITINTNKKQNPSCHHVDGNIHWKRLLTSPAYNDQKAWDRIIPEHML